MPLPSTKYTAGQQKFIQQRAHQMLVKWCDNLMLSSDHTRLLELDETNPYVRYAVDRKTPWLSDKGGGKFRMLGSGWTAAASFLKR